MRRLIIPLLVVLSAGLSAAQVERTPLVAIDYDRIRLANGGDLIGTIVAEDKDGALHIEVPGQKSAQVLAKVMWVSVDRGRSLADAVRRRGGEAIAAGDWLDVSKVLRFANERQKVDAADAAAVKAAEECRLAGIEIATAALVKHPAADLADLALPLAEAGGDQAQIMALARAGLAADPNWSAGHAALVKSLRAQRDGAGAAAAVRTWLERQPTALLANRELAATAEDAGDLKTAQEAWRKGFDLHQNLDCAVGLARTALRRGEYAEAIRAARALIEQQHEATAGRVMLGAAQTALGGDDKTATEALEQALADAAITADLADLARYDLGLLRLRAGRAGEAEALWRQVQHPVAKLALAQLGNGRIDPAVVAALPASLQSLAGEQQAVAELRSGNPAPVLRLDPKASKRNWELNQYAQILRTKGADEAIKTIASITTVEARRWAAYGHLIAGRLPQTEAILDTLPPNDGWAICTRVYLAKLAKDDVAAKGWYDRLATADAPPADYVARLSAEFASANDEEMRETFDWPDGDAPPTGWQASAPGTGIRIRADAGRLVLDGTQDGPGVTRAFRLVPADRLRGVQIVLDASQATASTATLEVCDEARTTGVAVGTSSGKPGWRELKTGTWGPWNALPFAADPGGLVRIEADAGRLWATPLADPTHRIPIGTLRPEGAWGIGVAVEAEPGSAFSLAADELLIQLRPAARRP